jgi:Protein of unknown function (DUF992)
MLTTRTASTALVLIIALAAPAGAQTSQRPAGPPPGAQNLAVPPFDPSAKVGMLNCNVGPEVGFIVGGRAQLNCRFSPSGSSYAAESYTGEITTVGLDIGVSKGGKLAWAVFMPTNGPQHGALAGDYAGVSGSAAVGVGVGGNVLVGGSNRSVTLQPFSVEGDTGINLAVGVSDMVLRPGS